MKIAIPILKIPECDIDEWRNLINEWIEMVDEDEIINQTDEENSENLEPLIDCVMDLDQILRKQHPLTNKNAKWKLVIYLILKTSASYIFDIIE
ncbi:hypothetical protein RhiirA5_423474 [Rhizophagus irregularis]|uniref:Uncharacterized protein n=1 Tax=Rhizophagus irregularis TaxID=588596 RepID=A0A2N0P9X6_9GLOM|nr:hypothetical protein RhiirA5_423474 [Rhizophagus irregularis]CAB5370791.1 unnamed protein product [Rhizophagus irregularis]